MSALRKKKRSQCSVQVQQHHHHHHEQQQQYRPAAAAATVAAAAVVSPSWTSACARKQARTLSSLIFTLPSNKGRHFFFLPLVEFDVRALGAQ